eukprot:6485240-Amphidinium_carterae.1
MMPQTKIRYSQSELQSQLQLMRLFRSQRWFQKLHHHHLSQRRTPSQAGSRDRDGGSYMDECPLCTWRFHSANRRYLHLGLQHSVLLPKIGGVTQDNPNANALYMIPVLSAVRGPNGCTQWASDKIKSAYQTVVRNALALPRSDWPQVSSMRWGPRDDERFVPPKNVPPSHMDMPEQDQLAMFDGDTGIRIIATGQVIKAEIPDTRQTSERPYDRHREWRADSWSHDSFKEGSWQPTHHSRWDQSWGGSSWEREGDSQYRRSQSQSQHSR